MFTFDSNHTFSITFPNGVTFKLAGGPQDFACHPDWGYTSHNEIVGAQINIFCSGREITYECPGLSEGNHGYRTAMIVLEAMNWASTYIEPEVHHVLTAAFLVAAAIENLDEERCILIRCLAHDVEEQIKCGKVNPIKYYNLRSAIGLK